MTCSQCGEDLPEGLRFCDQCGAELAEAPRSDPASAEGMLILGATVGPAPAIEPSGSADRFVPFASRRALRSPR